VFSFTYMQNLGLKLFFKNNNNNRTWVQKWQCGEICRGEWGGYRCEKDEVYYIYMYGDSTMNATKYCF
jgi:hypothetical protein